jgi:hypothetical protein
VFVEDLAPFFDPATPGVVVGTINGATVNGSLEVDIAESLDNLAQSNTPAFMCAKAALPTVAVGNVVTIDGRNYPVRSIDVNDWDPIAVLHLNNP